MSDIKKCFSSPLDCLAMKRKELHITDLKWLKSLALDSLCT